MTTIHELIAENIEDRDARMERVAAWLYENRSRNFTDDDRDAVTDYVLAEELADNHPDKMTREEYPIMSMAQINRRRMREVSGSAAEYYGADRRNVGAPTRRRRTKYENRVVDQYAKSKNVRRRRAYNAFVAGRDWYVFNGERIPIAFILRKIPILPTPTV